ncbi:pitrilysin family protein [Leptolyngbya sp. FACHB-261]|uniref:M16 family metallopeptidase n=1 Tax=Leptolyngbya sp. FACHB-261 TaxID=2692806 RepID=UPI00168315D1|nr:pitrilysin family protein [Leptolyngbya sp. FACHB-261]MBD2099511.1 insulinase family protein [Leptolyngbya sp. FACHB-261]
MKRYDSHDSSNVLEAAHLLSVSTAAFPAEVSKLDNGLTLIYQAIPTTPVATVDVWVRAGARVEPVGWSGMAHFLEHMIFKGTERLQPGEFDRVIEEQGGITNAATSHDYAHYYITTAACYLPETLPYLAELLLHAAVPDAEFDRERLVVLEEIRRANDSPDWWAYQKLVSNLYEYHPYGRPVLGTEESLGNLTPEHMRAFHRRYYRPENMTVVVVGGIDREVALELVNRSFGNFPSALPGQACPDPEALALGTPFATQRTCETLPHLEQARLLLAWQGPDIEQAVDSYGLDLISVILAEGRSSRLVAELREDHSLVQGISASFSLSQESGLFMISAWLEAEHLEEAEQRVRKQLDTLIQEPVSLEELRRAQRLLCSDYAFATEAPGQIASLYGFYGTLSRPELSVLYPELIRCFEPEDLQGLAQRYLSPERVVTTIVQPEFSQP